MEYKQLLKHPFWQKKRLEILNRDGWKCIKCNDQFSNLQIHHLYYKPNLLPWEYPDECFETLCELCQKKKKYLKWLLSDGITILKKDFSNEEVDSIYFSIESKLKSNFHSQSAKNYMESIKSTIAL